MSMSMRDTIQNDKAKEDIKDLMKSALKKPNAAVGQSGLQVEQSIIFFQHSDVYNNEFLPKSIIKAKVGSKFCQRLQFSYQSREIRQIWSH